MIVQKKRPNNLYLIVDKDNRIVLDSQQRPTIYKTIDQAKRYKYKFNSGCKVVSYTVTGAYSFNELEDLK